LYFKTQFQNAINVYKNHDESRSNLYLRTSAPIAAAAAAAAAIDTSQRELNQHHVSIWSDGISLQAIPCSRQPRCHTKQHQSSLGVKVFARGFP